MFLTCCGISHRTALLEMRERFQLAPGELTAATADYRSIADADEAVVIASCNRMEFYSVTRKKRDPRALVADFYRARSVEFLDEYSSLFFVRHGSSAARHLFKVTSGLDSLVTGESQIVSQVKDAYSSACAASGPGPILHKMFHRAFQVSKRVRSETAVGDGVTGLAGASVDVARSKLEGKPEGFHILLIGVNSSSEIILHRLAGSAASATIANRTLSKAERLAKIYGARAVELEALPESIASADVIFSATSSKGYIVKPEMIGSRKERPLLAIDLAVPRDIDPELSAMRGVQLIDLDDLKHHLALISRSRQADLYYALQLVEEQVAAFEAWRLSTNGSEAAVRQLVELDRAAYVEKFRESFAPREIKALDAFSRQLCRQILRRVSGGNGSTQPNAREE